MDDFKSKFRNFQDVVVPNFLANGERQDITTKVIENGDVMRHQGKCLLRMCGVEILLEEDKLVDAQEFWDAKRAEQAKKLGEDK